jgi:DCN1-like protein 1/2
MLLAIFLDEKDLILIDGMEKFCAALDVDPTDVVMLVMAYHLKAENMCEFTRAGFIEGWTKLRYVGHRYIDCF